MTAQIINLADRRPKRELTPTEKQVQLGRLFDEIARIKLMWAALAQGKDVR